MAVLHIRGSIYVKEISNEKRYIYGRILRIGGYNKLCSIIVHVLLTSMGMEQRLAETIGRILFGVIHFLNLFDAPELINATTEQVFFARKLKSESVTNQASGS